MSEFVIETTGLRKEFRSRGRKIIAVKDVNLQVERGGVHGFLGPNGSGKTTTLRMLLGLIRPTRGQLSLLGEPVPQALPEVSRRVGAVVEQPMFTPAFSGRRNLELLGGTLGIGRRGVDQVLDEVGILARAKDPYKSYSLGMKQRLAIAAALLKDPELLILDEPTNGLDPQGIRDIRELIRHLGQSGVTVLLSSHILAEVQQVCSSVSILGHGELLTSGRVADLVGRAGVEYLVRVKRADHDRALTLLRAAGLDARPEHEHLIVSDPPSASAVTQALAKAEVYLTELTPQTNDLEQVFLSLTQDEALPSTLGDVTPAEVTPPSQGDQS